MKHYGYKKRLREAKHKNRLRRLKNWKNGTTASAERRKRIQATAKLYSVLLKHAEKIGMDLRKSLSPLYDAACEWARMTTEKICDCIGKIRGVEFKFEGETAHVFPND